MEGRADTRSNNPADDNSDRKAPPNKHNIIGAPEESDKLTKGALLNGTNPPEEEENKAMGFKVYLQKYWHAVITYCAVFWSFGMCVAFLGPTLLDLGCETSSDIRSISWVFFAQLLCSLIGASLAGYLVERVDANYIILAATIIIPISMAVIPFCKVLGALAVVLAVMGINMGVIDTLANLQMIQIFGEAVPPFLQAMHFCYGFGAFVSPMIAEPFLLNEDCTPFIDNGTKAATGLLEPSIQDVENDSSLPAHSLEQAQSLTEVQYAFWIMAATQLPIPFLVLSLILRRKIRGFNTKHQVLIESDSSPDVPHPTQTTASNQYGAMDKNGWINQNATNAAGSAGNFSRCHLIFIAVTTALMLFIYDGLQSAYGGYVYSYAVKSIVDLSSTEGAYLNALFWGTFALGRLISIPVATKYTPSCMLAVNVSGCLFAMTLMLFLRHDHRALYVGTGLFGMFLSSITPTVLSLAEQFIDLSSRITSVIVVVGAVGEMICPVIVGNAFVAFGPVSFLGFGEFMCLISILVFLLLWTIGRNSPKYLAKGTTSFIWCTACLKPSTKDDEVLEPELTQHVKYHQQMSTESSGTIEMTNVKSDTEKVLNSYDGRPS